MTTTTSIVQTLRTPDGAFTLITDEQDRVLGSGWTGDADTVNARIHPALRSGRLQGGTSAAALAVTAYYDGDIAAIMAVPVVQRGTALQERGWSALREIAPGAPLSYAAFAERLGNARAVRAAASICARNAPALFVPCHRVLRTDGSLGGFAWGVEVKRALLERERAQR